MISCMAAFVLFLAKHTADPYYTPGWVISDFEDSPKNLKVLAYTWTHNDKTDLNSYIMISKRISSNSWMKIEKCKENDKVYNVYLYEGTGKE